jgi:lambda family phage minor tail protein L
MSTQSHNTALLDLEPDTLIELYEIDLGEQDGLYRFHPGKNNLKDIMLSDAQGELQTYYPLPIETSGWEMKGDGSLPRPKLLMANPQGLISDAIKRRGDLIGNTIIRKRIFMKFLDNENFPDNFNPFAIPDPNSRFDDDIFTINRKTQENKYYIEWELVSPLELEDVQVPARTMIADYCPWQYRGEGCSYGKRSDFKEQAVTMANQKAVTPTEFFANDNGVNLGIPLADENNKKFTTPEGYNLTLNWCGDYVKDSVTVTADGAATLSTVTINNGAGYAYGDTSMTVDSLPVAIASGKVITFANGAEFTLSSLAGATAVSVSGNFRDGDSVADNEVGTVAQTVSVDALPAAIDKDRTIVFSTGATLKLDTDAAKTAASLSGVLSAALADNLVGSTKYVAGDVIRIISKIENIAKKEVTKTQENLETRPDQFYVCIEEVATSSDPRYTMQSWRSDQCSKTLNGCKCRYVEYGIYRLGLPFGGFPSIEKYRYQ